MVHGQVINDALSHARLGSILFKCPFWSVLYIKVEIPIHCNGHFIIFSPGGGEGGSKPDPQKALSYSHDPLSFPVKW